MKENETVDVIAFGAHPDDVELACGGTLVKLVKQGRRVGIVDLTKGEMGTRGSAEIREREAADAAAAIGAAFRIHLDFGDGGLRTGREEELELIRVIRKYRPSVVIAPYPDDRHPDHTRAGRVVTEAAFYAGLRKIENGLDAHRPNAVLYFFQIHTPQPSFVVDVTAEEEQKMAAIRCFRSQFYNPQSDEPSTKIAKKSFLDVIEGRARHYGEMIGAEFGEPFLTKLPPRVEDVIGAYAGREV